MLATYPRLSIRGNVVAFLCVLAAAGAIHLTGLPELADLKLLDLEYAFLRSHFPRPAERDVVVVGIDEATVAAIREPLTLWHRQLGRFSHAMALARPAAVGIDVVLPDRSFETILPGYDKALLLGLIGLRKTSPVVLAITLDAAGKPRAIYPPFVSAAGDGGMGLVMLRADQDKVIRRFDERLDERYVGDASRVPTLAGQMAQRMGAQPSAGWIDYSLGQPFDYVPLQTVLQWEEAGDSVQLEQTFRGKPVMLGSVLPFEDRLRVPVKLTAWDEDGSFAPGVLIHAQALRSILGPGLVRPAPVLLPLALSLFALGLWFVPLRPAYAATVVVCLALLACTLAVWSLYHGTFLPISGVMLSAVFAVGARLLVGTALQLRERRRLRRAFMGYASPQIMTEIIEGRFPFRLGGDRLRICILFADIRDFTTRSEIMPPEAVIALLNRYFERVTSAIHERGGTVDKFIGDGIMAFFGAPKPMANPCADAFAAARAMLARLDEINRELEREGAAPLRIGIGLHVGDAIVGLVGSTTRNEYTAIGDAVNVASRLEHLTRDTGYPLVCSRQTRECLDSAEGFTYLGLQAIKGHTPVETYGWRASHASGSANQ